MNTVARPWLPASAAAKQLNISVYEIFKLSLSGRIRSKCEPGETPKFSAEDIELLRSERADASA